MQICRGGLQQEMGMWMLNMQFDADKGLVFMRKCTYTETDLKKIRMANSSKQEDLVIYHKLKIYTFLLNFMNARV